MQIAQEDLPDFVEDVLVSTYISLFGHRPPSDWVFKPRPVVVQQLLAMLKEPEIKDFKEYLQNALCLHVYSELKEKERSPAPFFNCNTRLVQEDFVAQLLKNKAKIAKKFQKFLDKPSAFFQQVFSEIFITETTYLDFLFANKCRGVKIPWKQLNPLPSWYLFCITGFEGYPVNRPIPQEAIESWKQEYLFWGEERFKLENKLPTLKANLSIKAVRAVFFDTAVRALEEAATKWAINWGFAWRYTSPVNPSKLVLHPKSLIKKELLRPSFPLVKRDAHLILTAYNALKEAEVQIEPLPEETTPVFEESNPPSFSDRHDLDNIHPVLANVFSQIDE